LLIIKVGNPRLCRGDSRSLTVPGIAVRIGLEFVSFPLTLALSPRRGRPLAPRWKIRRLRRRSPLLCRPFRRHTTTNLGRIAKARGNVSPSPGGEGWGEGEQDTRSLGCLRFELGAGKPPEGPQGFEPFIISSLPLCRRSLSLLDTFYIRSDVSAIIRKIAFPFVVSTECRVCSPGGLSLNSEVAHKIRAASFKSGLSLPLDARIMLGG
jgi:hypothetical protein